MYSIAILIAVAHAQDFAAKVAVSKAKLVASADEAFVKTWAEMSESSAIEEAGITAQQTRLFSRWAQAGANFGVCKSYAEASDVADWISAFDAIPVAAGPEAAAARSKFRQIGQKIYSDMSRSQLSDLGLTALEQEELCTVELEAARQVSGELK